MLSEQQRPRLADSLGLRATEKEVGKKWRELGDIETRTCWTLRACSKRSSPCSNWLIRWRRRDRKTCHVTHSYRRRWRRRSTVTWRRTVIRVCNEQSHQHTRIEQTILLTSAVIPVRAVPATARS